MERFIKTLFMIYSNIKQKIRHKFIINIFISDENLAKN